MRAPGSRHVYAPESGSMTTKRPHRPEERRPAPGSSIDVSEPIPSDTEAEAGEATSLSPLYFAAIGASAGGLESLCELFDHLPAPSPVAIAVLMHLSPDRTSNLVEILAAHSMLPVEEIQDGGGIEPGRVYVGPPGMRVTVDVEGFHLTPRVDAAEHVIDTLLQSVAESWQQRAIGVVLSGSGSDGSRGVGALREAEGFTMAEDPATAAFRDMPLSAIRTGAVDVVGSPASLGAELGRYLSFERAPSDLEPSDRVIRQILGVVADKRGRDFHTYRTNTIRRRIGRRMRLTNSTAPEEYIELIRDDAEELDQLVRDLLISVTQFFRDPDSWERLRATAVADILDHKADGDLVRIWVPGCSTGEEAYSLCMLFTDEIRDRGMDVVLQVFATDLDHTSLEMARAGVYPTGIEADVPQTILDRYFRREGESYQVSKQLRQSVIFSVQDLIHDPPFSHMDLVSCRNVLIYLESEVQKRVLSYLRYALEPEGYLFLGVSESIIGSPHLFEATAHKEKIFKKLPGGRVPDFRFPVSYGPYEARPREATRIPSLGGRLDLSRMAQRLILKRYAPPGVLVNLDHQVVYYLGDTTPYLSPPAGVPDLDVGRLARTELGLVIHRVLDKVERERAVAMSRPVSVGTGESRRSVRITAHPVSGSEEELAFIFLAFEPVEPPLPEGHEEELSEVDRSLVAHLEEELRRVRDELRATIETKDATNEELKSVNEELISMNEELQSTNEELETAKEELQSVNEELETVNNELNVKIHELSRTNSDMENLLASTRIATLFLDTALRIKSYTPSATDLFKLIASDRGRPLSDIVHTLDVVGLDEHMRRVLRTLQGHEETVRDQTGRVYAMRILPYRTAENVIDGVVVTFVDITARKRAEAEAARLGRVVQASMDAVIVTGEDGRIETWSQGAALMYGYDADTAIGMPFSALLRSHDIGGAFASLVEKASAAEGPVFVEGDRVTIHGRVVHVWSTLTALPGEDDAVKLVFIERDVTARKKVEQHREFLLRELDHRVKNTLATVKAIARQTLANAGASPERFAEAFQGRIDALARVNEALSEQRWSGVDVASLVGDMLAPYGDGDRVRVSGTRVVLPADSSVSLAIALHELATNASKYGALSVEDGHVEVVWTVDPDRTLQLEWKEEGGPPVSEPERQGLGLSFLRRGLGYELDADVDVRFAREGVSCSMRVPLPGGSES